MQEVLEVNIIQKVSQVNNAIIKQKGVKVECQGMFTAVSGQALVGLSHAGNAGMLLCTVLLATRTVTQSYLHGSKTGRAGQGQTVVEQYANKLLMMPAFVHVSYIF